MRDFVHLHVHTQYSILDGQASVQKLVDKAIADGMKGIAVTDHGNMFGIKEFWNYVGKKNKARRDRTKFLRGLFERMEELSASQPDIPSYLDVLRAELDTQKRATPATDDEDEHQKRIDKLAARIADIEQMDKEFRYDVDEGRQIVEKAEAVPDFKAIIGCEVYVARNGMAVKNSKEDQSGYHLILLAKNLKGYKNLIKIVSKAWTEGFYMRPRTDHAELEKYHEGLICCSACLGGEIPKLINAGRLDDAERAILWHKRVFGGDYYLELQLHKATVERANHEAYEMQLVANRHIAEFAAKHDIKLVCTNDVHFTDEDDAEAHDRLICLNTGRDLDDPKRMLYSKQEWMKTREEMNAIFGDEYPESLTNTVEICNKVEAYSIDHDPIMPMFDIPADFGTEEEYRKRFSERDLFDEFTRDYKGEAVVSDEEGEKKIKKLGGYDKLYRIKLEADYLAHLTMIGAAKRYGSPLSAEVEDRLRFELHIMKTMGFPGYFLIVQDFIAAARKELDVWVGPGRGSAAGSAVAYCLGITQVDPIAYDLLFERFLNPDRISLPDIDIDFDDDGRGRVLDWVTKKYGKEKVAHIITYGTMATKMVLKDVARVQRLPLPESDRLCKLVPDRITDPKDRDKTLKINLTNVINAVPEMQEAENSDNPALRDTIKYARKLEGNVRGTGVHACGTIICRDDITDWVPVSTADDKETGQKMLVTQYEGAVIEDTGLIKMDFLGLKNLSILKDAVANIRRTKGVEVDIDTIPIDDPATYKLYSEGRTVGTFQFESLGMQRYLKELKPSVFEDLIAMNALYRPGPMDYIPDFVNRKHGRSPIVYDIPIMEKYLKDTYGITVYQEQVMLLSRLLANFTRGESDTLRKAMGKKIKSKLDELRPKFISGGMANGHDRTVLEKIWKDWEKFASYAFNKSHATCYSWVAYQTAYLKANYPSEYMAALLSRNLNNIETLTEYMGECKHMNINVLSPDINESMLQFSSDKQGDVRFGLAAIKGVGEAAVMSIIAEREKNGRFKDIYDFVERVNMTLINRKCMENIAYAGGFDSIIGFSRCKFFASDVRDASGTTFVELLMRYGQRFQSEKNNAQQSLFGSATDTVDLQRPLPPVCDEWNRLMLLNKEKEVIGLYLSSHPLDEYKVIIDNMCNARLSDLKELEPLSGKEIVVAGVVTGVDNLFTKGGKPFGAFTLEDYSGEMRFNLFNKDYEQFRPMMFKEYFLLVRGRVQPRPYGKEDVLEFKITSMMQLDEVREHIKEVRMNIPVDIIDRAFIDELTTVIKHSKGKGNLKFTLRDDSEGVILNMFAKKLKVSVTPEFTRFVEEHEGVTYNIS